jgi:hypothetical protein
MEEVRMRTGLVGYFDILGYQSFLENNEEEDAARLVLTVLNGIPGKIHEDLLKTLKNDTRDGANPEKDGYLADIAKSLHHLFISDSIFLTMPCKEVTLDHWFTFHFFAILLCFDMFMQGLPVRGAILFGKYMLGGTSLAGKTIVDVYRLANSLDLAACRTDESQSGVVQEYVERRRQQRREGGGEVVFEKMVVQYSTPIKGRRQ